MKLACVAPGYPYRGGISHFATRLAIELAQRHECRFVNFTRLYPNLLFPGKTQLDTSRSVIKYPSERIIDSIYPPSWRRAGGSLRKWGAEAIIFHWWHPFFGPAFRAVSAGVGSRQVVRIAVCHNVAPHEKGGLWRRAAGFGLASMDGFIVHAQQEASQLDGLIRDNRRIVLFHPVYDVFPDEDLPMADARERLGLNADDKVVLYFGLIRPYKGVEVLLKAMAELKDRVPGIKLLVVGEIYSNRDSILRLVNSLPDGLVRLVDDYVPNEEVSTYFRAADIVALPYLSATQSGIVPIAYRCMRPVIVTRTGGLPDAVIDGESGYLVEPGNARQIAETVRKHFSQSGGVDMSGGITRMLHRLSWKRYADELDRFIRELKDNSPSQG